jgi:hypothetical protein
LASHPAGGRFAWIDFLRVLPAFSLYDFWLIAGTARSYKAENDKNPIDTRRFVVLDPASGLWGLRPNRARCGRSLCP